MRLGALDRSEDGVGEGRLEMCWGGGFLVDILVARACGVVDLRFRVDGLDLVTAVHVCRVAVVVDGVPAAAFDEVGDFGEEAVLQAGYVCATAGEDDAAETCVSDVNGQRKKGPVDEDRQGELVVIVVICMRIAREEDALCWVCELGEWQFKIRRWSAVEGDGDFRRLIRAFGRLTVIVHLSTPYHSNHNLLDFSKGWCIFRHGIVNMLFER